MKCCICGKEIKGYGNNAEPLVKNGKCCDVCNNVYVILTRCLLLSYQKNKDRFVEDLKSTKNNSFAKVGLKVIIIDMKKEQDYTGRFGVITHIDDIGQLHGTWGGCALIPSEDVYVIINEN